MEKDNLIRALINLEVKYNRKEGYNIADILKELNIEYNDKIAKKLRKYLRSMIDRKQYPEFKTAGNCDTVYCPSGKNTGFYRLSKYRDKNDNNK